MYRVLGLRALCKQSLRTIQARCTATCLARLRGLGNPAPRFRVQLRTRDVRASWACGPSTLGVFSTAKAPFKSN